MHKASSGGLVYSSDGGRMCPGCRQPVAACSCQTAPPVPARTAKLRVGLETQGRAGKAVTVVRGLPLDATALASLGKKLRMACGSGGTAKDGILEVQGDHVEKTLAFLTAQGFAAQRGGS